MKKEVLVGLVFLSIIVLSVSMISAYSLNDYWNKMTGKVVDSDVNSNLETKTINEGETATFFDSHTISVKTIPDKQDFVILVVDGEELTFLKNSPKTIGDLTIEVTKVVYASYFVKKSYVQVEVSGESLGKINAQDSCYDVRGDILRGEYYCTLDIGEGEIRVQGGICTGGKKCVECIEGYSYDLMSKKCKRDIIEPMRIDSYLYDSVNLTDYVFLNPGAFEIFKGGYVPLMDVPPYISGPRLNDYSDYPTYITNFGIPLANVYISRFGEISSANYKVQNTTEHLQELSLINESLGQEFENTLSAHVDFYGSETKFNHVLVGVYAIFDGTSVEENRIPLNESELIISLISGESRTIKIYSPKINCTGVGEKGHYQFFYVSDDGSTYYAREDHGCGRPDLEVYESLVSEHLARASLVSDTPQISCTDSDGGENIYVKGVVNEKCTTTESGNTVCSGETDFCQGDILYEQYCESNFAKENSHTCPNGCVDGACVLPQGKQSATCASLTPDGKELPPKTRVNDNGKIKYCNPLTLEYSDVKEKGEVCANDFECSTNVCADGKCISITEELQKQSSLLKKIWCWIQNPISEDERNRCLVDEEEEETDEDNEIYVEPR
ncbi:MAG: hypothetical protein Q8P15_04160 [Nanoarchaeota archaeon]|nr:hypothetical protein [Nanoarchaeota archaeon]